MNSIEGQKGHCSISAPLKQLLSGREGLDPIMKVAIITRPFGPQGVGNLSLEFVYSNPNGPLSICEVALRIDDFVQTKVLPSLADSEGVIMQVALLSKAGLGTCEKHRFVTLLPK